MLISIRANTEPPRLHIYLIKVAGNVDMLLNKIPFGCWLLSNNDIRATMLMKLPLPTKCKQKFLLKKLKKTFCSHFLSLLRDEITLTRKIGSLRYFYSASYFFSAILVIVSAIVPHALSKGIILRRIFTTASYCMVLRMTLTRQLPGSIQMWYDTLALVKKIEVSQRGGGIGLREILSKYSI